MWRARHVKLDIPVAVKLMSPVLAASEAARARFEREAKAAARLKSPHVVEVHDYGVEADGPYIVMEYLEGEDLATRLGAKKRLPLHETADLVEQIAKALEVAHDAGVVHRDLKPANVFLARTGQDEIVKVLDFGVAKMHAEPGALGTVPGTVMGSPSYMSPEQARGQGTIDHRSDVWALGVVAFECLTGRAPFTGATVTDLILAILNGSFSPVSKLVAGSPVEIDPVFERALARSADDRFQSARTLADALRAVVGGPPRSLSLPPSRPFSDPNATTPIARRASHGSGAGSQRGVVVTPSSEAYALMDELLATEGEVIAGRFEVGERAGEGGMGVVYRAKDRVTGGPVALKLLRAATLDTERFFREARVLAELRHPGVVRYVAHGVTGEGRLYLAMEWLDGGDLARRLRLGAFDLAQSLMLVSRVAEALGAAHRVGVIHGDLKPSNVLLSGGSAPGAKVIDFGIARLVHRSRGPLPRSGVVLGTPGYMAPEQARGDADMDARADVFALGCLLFECLTARPPFLAETALASLGRVVSEPTPRARDFAPLVPHEVDELLAKLLAKARDDRPADGAKVAEMIANLVSRTTLTPRARETITGQERKLLPVIMLVPAAAAGAFAPEGMRLASEARSEDATLVVGADVVLVADRVGTIARRFQARSEVLANGAVAVTWSGAGPLSDQVTQAAMCALALRGSEPDATIAIATGRRGSTGDVVERAAVTAARAIASETTGGVALDETTFGLLEGRFEIERGPVGHVLLGQVRADGEERRLLGKTTPCAGREPELGMLEALFRECAEEPAAKVVVLKGPAGVGKSRVRQELLRRLARRGEELRVWIGRGDVMNAGSPFAMLSHALLSMLELSGGEPEEVRRERLRARVAQRVAKADAERVALFLGDMIGIPLPSDVGPEVAAAREDALVLGDQRRRAFEDFVAAECSASPVLLVLEDLHLGDLPTVKLIDVTLRALADRPLFVLATARPELDDLFPKIWEERVPQEIRVGPLSAKASEKIVRHVLGAQAAPELVARIVGRAAGHPLHLEEIVRAVAESPTGELPDTVLAMVEARIGALDPGARRVLRAASVFGRSFWEGAVVTLTPLPSGDVRDWLHDLEEREWITRAPMSRFTGELEYTIAQDLVQEAAYAMLPEDDRTLGHALAGEWLAASGERDAIVLARHFVLGNAPEQAAGWLLRAAEQALDGNDFESAVKHAERAAELDPSPLRKARASAVAAEAHLHRGEIEAAKRRAFEATAHLPPSEAGYFRAAAAGAIASGKLGDLAAVGGIAKELLALRPEAVPVIPFAAATASTLVQLVIGGERAFAEKLFERLESVVRALPEPEPAALAQVARAGGILAAFAGDLFGSITHQRASIEAFDAAGDVRAACGARKTLGWYLGECGALEEAERALREAIVTFERLGLTNLAPHAKHDLGSPLLRLGKLEEARRSQEEALVAFQAQGDRRLESGARAMLAAVATADGRFEDAEREALAAASIAPSAPLRFTALARLAESYQAAGRPEDAVRVADEALAIVAETGNSEECLVVCLLARAECLFALGKGDEAGAALERARGEIEGRAAQIRDPELRASFLLRIPENARVMELVRARAPL